MTKPNILITAVCGDIGSSTVRALHGASGKSIGCDMRPYCPVLDYMDGFYIAPPASEVKKYLQFIEDIVVKEAIDIILPISEPEITLMNEQRDHLESLGVKLMMNSPLIIENFLDKIKTVEFIEKIGLKAPKTVLLRRYAGDPAFPLIIKPRTGYGSKRLWKVDNSLELDFVRSKDDGSLIVQEYLGSDSEEYTTGVFSDGRNISTITFRRRLGYGGLSAEAILADSPYLDGICMKIAKAAGLMGSINVQTRRIEGTKVYVPFEINPRISSTLLFRKKFGFDDAVWWLEVLEGRSYTYHKKYKAGTAIRHVSESYFDLEEAN